MTSILQDKFASTNEQMAMENLKYWVTHFNFVMGCIKIPK